MLYHSIDPVFDENSRILLLGSFPSPKSRETGFYYGHPQNRFWKVLSALWDVLASCEIDGASDASIRNAAANDLSRITSVAPIRKIFATGQTAAKLYRKLTGGSIAALPSTSPANCMKTLGQLTEAYRVILNDL